MNLLFRKLYYDDGFHDFSWVSRSIDLHHNELWNFNPWAYTRPNLTTLIHIFKVDLFLTRFHFLKHGYFLRTSIHIQSKGFWSYFSGKFFFDRFKPDYTSSIEFNSPYKLNEGAIKGIYINIISEYYFWNFTKNVLMKILFLFIWERSSQFSSQN